MRSKTILSGSLVLILSVGAWAEDKPQASETDLDALRAQLRSQEEQLNKLAQEVAKINETLKEHGLSGPVPRAEAVVSPSSSAATTSSETPADKNQHIVAKGETLTSIAKQYGVAVGDLEKLNKIQDARKLQVGQALKIPPGGTAPSPSASPSPAAAASPAVSPSPTAQQ